VTLLEDALIALELVAGYEGPIVDVGSGNGSPGLPLAYCLPQREVVLLEAQRRRCEFLRAWAPPNARVVWGRAEEQATDWAGVALAKALAPPTVAAEWCLPLVRSGGVAILWVGKSAERDQLAAAAGRLAAEAIEGPAGLAVFRKTGRTPPGFPRRPGIARRRPLA